MAIGAALLAAIAAWIGWRGYAGIAVDPSAPAVATEPVPAAVTARTTPAGGDRAVPAIGPLPAPGTPLRLVFDELMRRADNGEASAACRLAAELEACEQARNALSTFEEQMRQQEARLDAGPVQPPEIRQQRALAEALERRSKALLERIDQCDGVPHIGPAERAGYWRRAALAGHPPALGHYAVGNAFRLRDTLQVLPQLQVYRDEAERLALQAAAAGDVRTTLALAAAYAPRREAGMRPFLAQIVDVDPVRSLALYLHVQEAEAAADDERLRPLQSLLERGVAQLRSDLDARQQSQAQALAGQWRHQWRAPDLSGPGSRLMVHGNGGVADIRPDDCSR